MSARKPLDMVINLDHHRKPILESTWDAKLGR